jgi:hypothetical protein
MCTLKSKAFSVLLMTTLLVVLSAFGQTEPEIPPRPLPPTAPSATPRAGDDVIFEVETDSNDPVQILLEEVARLREEVFRARNDLAAARMQAEQATRELEEMRQFMNDHDQYGRDYQQYRGVKEIAEREARQRQAQAARQQREVDRQERLARAETARQQRELRNAESNILTRYRRMGFSPVGLDVYAGKMAFFYDASDGNDPVRIDYSSVIGDYLRPIETGRPIDYSTMTISGSVLSGSDEIRNIGVAITFFDNNGNQVGHEIIKVNNARPDVPYPFTSKINMALNRAFDSSSMYVLYADPIDDGSTPGDSTTTTQGATPPPPAPNQQPYP